MRAHIWDLRDEPLVVDVDFAFCQGHLPHLAHDTPAEDRLSVFPGHMFVYVSGPMAGMARMVARTDYEFIVLSSGGPALMRIEEERSSTWTRLRNAIGSYWSRWTGSR